MNHRDEQICEQREGNQTDDKVFHKFPYSFSHQRAYNPPATKKSAMTAMKIKSIIGLVLDCRPWERRRLVGMKLFVAMLWAGGTPVLPGSGRIVAVPKCARRQVGVGHPLNQIASVHVSTMTQRRRNG